jgi:septal ring factor EnvC (AmiA/AmiB activator)
MKDVEQLKKENEDLRQELANVKLALRQSNASQQSLDDSFAKQYKEAHALKTQLIVLSEDLDVEKKKSANLEANLKEHEEKLRLVEKVA